LLVRENGALDPQNRSDTAFFLPLTETRQPALLPIRAPMAPGALIAVSPARLDRVKHRKIASEPRHLIAPHTGEIIWRGIDKLHRFVISRANFSVWYA
jgi:hypothetical protein